MLINRWISDLSIFSGVYWLLDIQSVVRIVVGLEKTVIKFTSFVVGWMGAVTKYTLGWGVSLFLAGRSTVGPGAFHTCIWSIAV